MAKAGSAEQTVREIRRRTRRRFSAEEKIRIVLEGLRGESRHPLTAVILDTRLIEDRQRGATRVSVERRGRGGRRESFYRHPRIL